MSVLHSLIGKRHFLTSTLVGTVGVFLPVTAAHAQTTPPSPASAGTLAVAATTASPNATVAGTSVIGAAMAQPSGFFCSSLLGKQAGLFRPERGRHTRRRERLS
jgi:hypothetical protein